MARNHEDQHDDRLSLQAAVRGLHPALAHVDRRREGDLPGLEPPDRGPHSQVSIRDFTLDVDEPPSLAGSDQGPNPVELALASLATCQQITYRLYADALGVRIDHVSVSLEGDLDLRGFFSVDPGIRPGFAAIRGTIDIDSPESPETITRLTATMPA